MDADALHGAGQAGPERSRRSTAPFLVGLLTLVLTLYLAFQSSELHSADLALREYQDLVNERPQEKLYQAWKMFRFERVLNLSQPPLKPLDEYQKLADATRELGDKRSAILKLLVRSSELHIVPPLFSKGWYSWTPGGVNAVDGAGSASDAYPQGSAASALAVQPPGAAAAGAAPVPHYGQGPGFEDSCAAAPEPGPVKAANGVPGRSELAAYMKGIDCFLRTLNVSSADYNYPMWTAIYDTRNKVSLLVAWLLPGLYGLLGACVFLMRHMLLHGAVREEGVRALDVLSILLRIALGGLAGIIVGWFWVPTSVTTTSSAIAVSSVAFGVAFLAGFSIEGLFALLDRLNRTLVTETPARPEPAAKVAPA